MKQDWKLALAEDVRQSTGASIRWLAANLHLGGAATPRGYLHLRKSGKNQLNTASPHCASHYVTFLRLCDDQSRTPKSSYLDSERARSGRYA